MSEGRSISYMSWLQENKDKWWSLIKYWWNKFHLKVGFIIGDKHDLLKKADSFTNSAFFTTHSEYSQLQPGNLVQPKHSLGMEGTRYATCSQLFEK